MSLKMTSDAGTQNQIIPFEFEVEVETSLAFNLASGRKSEAAHLEDVVDDKVAADDDEKEGHMNPSEEAELPAELRPFEVGDERDEACNAEGQLFSPSVLEATQVPCPLFRRSGLVSSHIPVECERAGTHR